MKKAFKFLPTIVFLIFIFSMALMFIVMPKKEYSSSEKRYLAEFPTFTAQTFFSGEFGEDFEEYLSDHTPFRNMWVGLNSYYNLALGNPLSNGIYYCDDGYLVNDPPQTDRLLTNIEIIADFAKTSKLPTTVLLAPSTGYVVNDVLPNKHIVYNNDELFDSTNEILEKNNVNFVDIRNEFKQAHKNSSQLYYKTDHHWTSYGAYLAYCNLAQSLKFDSNEVDDYDITTHGNFYGTTYSSSGFWYTKPDDIEIWDSKNINDNSISVSITEGENTTVYDSMFFTDKLNDDDKYPVFLDGNHPYTVIENKDLLKKGNEKKLLIIKDSFAHSLTPFLADHFSQIVMVDMRYYKQSISQLIKENDFSHMLFVYSIDNLGTDSDIAWIK